MSKIGEKGRRKQGEENKGEREDWSGKKGDEGRRMGGLDGSDKNELELGVLRAQESVVL